MVALLSHFVQFFLRILYGKAGLPRIGKPRPLSSSALPSSALKNSCEYGKARLERSFASSARLSATKARLVNLALSDYCARNSVAIGLYLKTEETSICEIEKVYEQRNCCVQQPLNLHKFYKFRPKFSCSLQSFLI